MQTQTSPAPLRAGVIGLGWAGETHLKAYKTLPGVEVIGIADPNAARRDEVASAYNIPFAYSEFSDLIARDDLDVISIATPNYLHAPAAIAALESGKHVLCEKPMAHDQSNAQAMVNAARQHDRVLHIAFNHRQRGDVQLLKRYIDEGGIGSPYYAKAYWMRRSGIPGLGGWFTNKEMAGGGPLIDLGVHVLDMALFLLGEPEIASVSGMTYSELGKRGIGGRGDEYKNSSLFDVEDLATAFIRLKGGGTLLLEASWATYGRHWDDYGVEIFGNQGGAHIDVQNYGWENTLTIFTDTAGSPAQIRPKVTRGEGHLAVARQFIDAVRGGDYAAHHGESGLKRTVIIESCYQSARDGREIVIG
ncbi:MAG: Gfo/Idh/MocA family oxidoreductase [bacterium]|nr:Gfo/Idh/MocA family oxidoreductase [bacterium]